MAFIEFKATCSKTEYVAEYIYIYIYIYIYLSIRAFGGLYGRIPKLTYSSYPHT